MRIEAMLGDITEQRVDAVVNAANSALLGGGGVDGAIHRAAGAMLLAECEQVRRDLWPAGLPVGGAVATGAGRLPARWVVHTVGPNRHRGQRDPRMLADCFTSALTEAARVGARSVAFPAISAGVYGWDAAEVAGVAVPAVREWDREHPGTVDLVRFVLFSPTTLGCFQDALDRTDLTG